MLEALAFRENMQHGQTAHLRFSTLLSRLLSLLRHFTGSQGCAHLRSVFLAARLVLSLLSRFVFERQVIKLLIAEAWQRRQERLQRLLGRECVLRLLVLLHFLDDPVHQLPLSIYNTLINTMPTNDTGRSKRLRTL